MHAWAESKWVLPYLLLHCGNCSNCGYCITPIPQITAIMLLPSFPGVLAPLAFNPLRFEEFLSFAATIIGTWVCTGLLTGSYRRDATSGGF